MTDYKSKIDEYKWYKLDCSKVRAKYEYVRSALNRLIF